MDLAISKGKHKGRVLSLRQVTRRKPGPGGTTRQAHILTTRQAADLPAAQVIYRMTPRWREENYFRYGRARFALDSYAVTPDDPGRLVPNPAKKSAAAVKAARKAVAAARALRQDKLAALRHPPQGPRRLCRRPGRLDAPVHQPNATQTRYSSTSLTLHYEVKDHHGTA